MKAMTNPLLVLATLLALLASGCGKAKEKEAEAEGDAPVPVEVDAAAKGPIDLLVEADAVLYPANQSNVTSKIAAPVRRLLVSRGDHVKAGQLIAELESNDLAAAALESRSQIDQAQSALLTASRATVVEDRAKAEADAMSSQQTLEAAKKVYESRVDLQKQGALAQKLVEDAKVAMVMAQSQYDTARQHLQTVQQVTGTEQVKAAEAQVNTAKAHYDSANVQLAYAQIRSPLSGVVSERNVAPGELAQPGQPIMTILDVSHVVAHANIPIKQASLVKTGRQATLTSPEGVVTGTVTVVSPAVDPTTTTVEVWVTAENPGEKLKPGATVRLSIRADLIRDAILVPSSAILNSDEGGEKVMIFGADNKAHERKVNVGIREGNRVQILSGLAEGEKVITSGGLGLEDKAKVTMKSEDDDDDDDDDAADDAKPSPAAAKDTKK
jgi:HlyD family secretion protein